MNDTMKKPLLSICIYTYNKAEKISNLVNKLLQITSDDIEIVVLDNLSTDNTHKMLSDIRDKRFHWYYCKKHILSSPGKIESLRLGRGKYRLLLDDCSEIYEFHWEKINELLQIKRDTVCFYCEYRNQEGDILRQIFKDDFDRNSIEGYKKSMDEFPCGIIYRHDALEKAYSLADHNDYLYSISASAYISLLSAQYGNVSFMPNLIITRNPSESISEDKVNHSSILLQPKWTAESRLQQALGYIKIARIIPLDIPKKIEFLSQIFLDHLRFLVEYHDMIFCGKNIDIFDDFSTLLSERNRANSEYHILFWNHVAILNKTISSYHRGLSFMNESFILDINRIYNDFVKKLDCHSDDFKKTSDILLSICIPTYNRAKIVEQCVKNCLQIPLHDMEIVVSDNGSSDDTQERIEAINDYRLTYHRNSFNIGGMSNFVQTFCHAKGKWLLIISDEDDLKCTDWNEVRRMLLGSEDVSVFRLSVEKYVALDEMRYAHDTFAAYKFLFEKCFYVSGLIFNRDILAKCYMEIRKDNMGWSTYSHKVIALHCSKYGDVYATNKLEVINSRKAQHDPSICNVYALDNGEIFNMPEARFQQNISWMDITVSLASDKKVKSDCIDFFISRQLSDLCIYYRRSVKNSDKRIKYPSNRMKYINMENNAWKRLFFYYYKNMMKHARELRNNCGGFKRTLKKEEVRNIYMRFKNLIDQ